MSGCALWPPALEQRSGGYAAGRGTLTHSRAHTDAHTHKHACTHTHTHTHARTAHTMHTRTRAFTCTHTQTHAHTHTHTFNPLTSVSHCSGFKVKLTFHGIQFFGSSLYTRQILGILCLQIDLFLIVHVE